MKLADLTPQHAQNGEKFRSKVESFLACTPTLYDTQVYDCIEDTMSRQNDLITYIELNGGSQEDKDDVAGFKKSSDSMDTDSAQETLIYVGFSAAKIEFLRNVISEIDKLAKIYGSSDTHANDRYENEDSNIRPGNEEELGLPVWVFSSVYSFEDK